ncbi:MAG: 50S ribosomal protein L23 [Alphaproteobacteria bacterium]|nr:50S ribosomal protein L23 [Alphaproteobacteria bacterium]
MIKYSNFSHFDILHTPLITEKSSLIASDNKYIFQVSKDSNKSSISLAIEKIFAVKVKKVNIINQIGKTKRFKGKMGKRSDFKKAIVTLEKDNLIDFTGGIR